VPGDGDPVFRRTLLGAVGSVGLAGLSGCAGLDAPRARETTERASAAGSNRQQSGSDVDGDGEVSLAETGLPPTICEEPIGEDPGIPAVLEPAFDGDWSGIEVPDLYEGGLDDDGVVVGVERDGLARAYPLAILWWHEIVNDVVSGTELMVTFCPLCKSGVVASRVIGGEPTEFLVSGLLWQPERVQVAAAEANDSVFGADVGDPDAGVGQQGNLVMYDRATESYWSQIVATAICGPLEGERLSLLPSTVATWSDWQSKHPDTEVLLPPPHSRTTESEQ